MNDILDNDFKEKESIENTEGQDKSNIYFRCSYFIFLILGGVILLDCIIGLPLFIGGPIFLSSIILLPLFLINGIHEEILLKKRKLK